MLIAADRAGPVDYRGMLEEVWPQLEQVKDLVMVGDEPLVRAMRWDELCAEGERVSDTELAHRASSVDPDAPTLILYTSGTTSLPKGAVHSHIGMRQFHERAKLFGHTANDVHLSYLPLFHAFGYVDVSLMAGITGATQVLVENFDADTVLDLSEAEGGTVWHGFDTHWNDLLRAQAARPRRLDLRLGTLAAGMESSTAIARKVQEVFCPTVSGYGMSEVLPFVSASHPADTVEQRCEASGYPLTDIELRVIDPGTGAEQPPAEPGELLVRGYSVTLGYYKKPEATAELIDEEGWLHTGDMARIRSDGHVVFMGRYKDMLKIGGENVSPAEIETRLVAISGVAEAAVVGVADDRLGQVAFAFVVPEPGAPISADELLAMLQGRIASFKIPRHIRFVDALPATASGKVRKVELRTAAEQLLESSPM
jgi:fatty-acyl-CoA synthase